jgi:hypothetical protein
MVARSKLDIPLPRKIQHPMFAAPSIYRVEPHPVSDHAVPSRRDPSGQARARGRMSPEGLARRFATTSTLSANVVGTLDHMAPEFLRDSMASFGADV